MRNFDVVIIGGGPAGFATAMSARNTYPDKSVALVRKEEIALIPCGIPYTMHRLGSVNDDILPDTPLSNAGIEIIIDEVLNREGKVLHLANSDDIVFDKLVVATGSQPVIPPIPGIDTEGVFIVKKDHRAVCELKAALQVSQERDGILN